MGALHAGHLALIARARELAGSEGELAVSIFVNPLQFDRTEDLAGYPRTLDADLEACRDAGVDLVYAPAPDDFYPPDHSILVREEKLSRHLCGATRPGHFDGVCTVLTKLFLQLRPHHAVFGEKDWQQLAIVRRLARDLDLPLEIVGHPTLREPDGLALSSRNARLDPEQRADAPRVHQALAGAAAMLRDQPALAPGELLEATRLALESPLNRIDYLELVDAATLEPAEAFDRPTLLAAAVFYGEVRLIDNQPLPPRP